MPRKPLFENRVFVGFVIEKEHAKLIEAIARREGVSKSELCRRIIIDWLQSPETRTRYGLQHIAEAKTGEALVPVDPPVDPLTQVEWEEFESKLSSLENRTLKLEERLKALPAGGYGFKPGSGQQLQQLRKWLWDLRSDWDTLRSKYRELRSRIPASWDRKANEKLAQLKRRINSAAKLLYAR